MKNKLNIFILFVWEMLCVLSIVFNYKNFSLEEIGLIVIMMILPVTVSYIINKVNKNKQSLKRNLIDKDVKSLEKGLPVISDSPIALVDDELHYIMPAKLLSKTNRLVGGKLAVTNKRIVFVNRENGFDIEIADILAIAEYTSGISIKSKDEEYLMKIDSPRYLVALISKVMHKKK